MIDLKLARNTSRLDNIFSIVDRITEDELKSHFARDLCILTSGYIEESVKIILESYATNNSAPNIVNYVTSTSKNLTKLNSEKIEQLLGKFNPKLTSDFINSITDEETDALDSIVANRNNIAHGRNVGISYSRAKNGYKNAKSILDNFRIILSV